MGGRLEVDVRTVTLPTPSSSVTVQVSFKQAFTNAPTVVISPLSGKIGGVRFTPAEISGITGEGFNVTFESPAGEASTGSALFSYQAFGQ
jgi:hypothetical protein